MKRCGVGIIPPLRNPASRGARAFFSSFMWLSHLLKQRPNERSALDPHEKTPTSFCSESPRPTIPGPRKRARRGEKKTKKKGKEKKRKKRGKQSRASLMPPPHLCVDFPVRITSRFRCSEQTEGSLGAESSKVLVGTAHAHAFV